ncbi:Lysophospholipid_acyltransferase [Hexamita inflata]|uniref:Lysophospholipid acyltransferase n=1 Tax=Hexamita inflata TaxID=28002 RepID=A0AA86QLI3_9EUKA|nr:Lysophospholipid acyltransferase [Hexamita inflata]
MKYQFHEKHHPFAPVLQQKTVKYYLFWFISILLSPVVFPFRFACAMFAITVNYFPLKLLIAGKDMEKPLSKWRLGHIQFWQRLSSKLLIFSYGIIYRTANAHLRPTENAHVLISNHVSSADPVILAALGFTSFVGKEQIKHIPLYSTMAIAGQGIFVNRDQKNSNAAELINTRITNSKGFPLLTIFPEGTTVNQTALIQFKRGAFTAMKPVDMVFIQYSQKYLNASDAAQSNVKCTLKTMLALFTVANVEFMGQISPEKNETVQEYAERARYIYSNKFGLEKIECTWKDKYYFNGKIKDYQQTSEYYQQAFGKDVLRKNGYALKYDFKK